MKQSANIRDKTNTFSQIESGIKMGLFIITWWIFIFTSLRFTDEFNLSTSIAKYQL